MFKLATFVFFATLLLLSAVSAQQLYTSYGCTCQGSCAARQPALNTNRTVCDTQEGCGLKSASAMSVTGYFDFCDTPRPPTPNGTATNLCGTNRVSHSYSNGRTVLNDIQPAFGTGCLCCNGNQLLGVYDVTSCGAACSGAGYLLQGVTYQIVGELPQTTATTSDVPVTTGTTTTEETTATAAPPTSSAVISSAVTASTQGAASTSAAASTSSAAPTTTTSNATIKPNGAGKMAVGGAGSALAFALALLL